MFTRVERESDRVSRGEKIRGRAPKRKEASYLFVYDTDNMLYIGLQNKEGLRNKFIK